MSEKQVDLSSIVNFAKNKMAKTINEVDFSEAETVKDVYEVVENGENKPNTTDNVNTETVTADYNNVKEDIVDDKQKELETEQELGQESEQETQQESEQEQETQQESEQESESEKPVDTDNHSTVEDKQSEQHEMIPSNWEIVMKAVNIENQNTHQLFRLSVQEYLELNGDNYNLKHYNFLDNCELVESLPNMEINEEAKEIILTIKIKEKQKYHTLAKVYDRENREFIKLTLINSIESVDKIIKDTDEFIVKTIVLPISENKERDNNNAPKTFYSIDRRTVLELLGIDENVSENTVDTDNNDVDVLEEEKDVFEIEPLSDDDIAHAYEKLKAMLPSQSLINYFKNHENNINISDFFGKESLSAFENVTSMYQEITNKENDEISDPYYVQVYETVVDVLRPLSQEYNKVINKYSYNDGNKEQSDGEMLLNKMLDDSYERLIKTDEHFIFISRNLKTESIGYEPTIYQIVNNHIEKLLNENDEFIEIIANNNSAVINAMLLSKPLETNQMNGVLEGIDKYSRTSTLSVIMKTTNDTEGN